MPTHQQAQAGNDHCPPLVQEPYRKECHIVHLVSPLHSLITLQTQSLLISLNILVDQVGYVIECFLVLYLYEQCGGDVGGGWLVIIVETLVLYKGLPSFLILISKGVGIDWFHLRVPSLVVVSYCFLLFLLVLLCSCVVFSVGFPLLFLHCFYAVCLGYSYYIFLLHISFLSVGYLPVELQHKNLLL